MNVNRILNDANRLVDTEGLPSDLLRQAYARFPSGVTAVCAIAEGQPAGIAASSFTSVSLDPPLVSVCIAHTSATWPMLRQASRLGVSVLAESQERIALALASKSIDRFASIDWVSGPDGSVFIVGAALWLECQTVEEFPAGDHVIALLKLNRLSPHPRVSPMVFHASKFTALARN